MSTLGLDCSQYQRLGQGQRKASPRFQIQLEFSKVVRSGNTQYQGGVGVATIQYQGGVGMATIQWLHSTKNLAKGLITTVFWLVKAQYVHGVREWATVDLMINALSNHFIDKHTINQNTTIYTVCQCYGLATVTRSWVNLSLNTRCSLSLQEKKNRREPGNFASKAVDFWHMITCINDGQTMSTTIYNSAQGIL